MEKLDRNKMPEVKEIYPYILIVLQKLSGAAKPQKAIVAVAELLQLSDEVLKQKTKKNKRPEFEFRVRMARQQLCWTKYIDDSKKGTWALLNKGKKEIKNLIERDEYKLQEFRKRVDKEGKIGIKNKKESEDTTMEKLDHNKMPEVKEIRPYILIVLQKLGGAAKPQKAIVAVAELLQLSDEVLKQKTKKNKRPEFVFRVRMARQQLCWTKYIDDSKKGTWALLNKGKKEINNLIERDAHKLQEFRERVDKEWKIEIKKKNGSGKPEIIEEDENISDAELKELKQTNEYIETYIVDKKLENLCVYLFKASGYKDVKKTRYSGDEGIDGSGVYDTGLTKLKVVFQAKGHKKSGNRIPKVQKRDVRELNGSKGDANKALLITNASFTSGAKEAAANFDIELIDGKELAKLIKKHKIGYKMELNKDWYEDL